MEQAAGYRAKEEALAEEEAFPLLREGWLSTA
jgi:hypothetical protein